MNRRTLLKAGAISLGTVGLPVSLAAPAAADPHGPTTLASRLKVPWGMTFVGRDALVGERDTCAIYRVAATGGKTLVGVVGGGVTRLMGLALSPWYATDRLVYALAGTANDVRVIRFTYDGTRLGTVATTFVGPPRGAQRLGGGIAFGADRMLYAAVGDQMRPDLARDTTTLFGKTLRLRPNGTIPTDNPFGNAVWTSGHRNVESIALDSSGQLWAPEFGEDTTDGLLRLVRGGDYGWPDFEGGVGAGPGVVQPFVTWSPSICSPSGVAIIGGYAYVAALRGTALWRVKRSAPNARRNQRFLFGTYGRIRSAAAAPDGSLWIATSNTDSLGTPGATDDRIIRLLT